MARIEDFKNKIDDYEQTVHAIIGFINFYRWDDTSRQMRGDTYVFQGMRLRRSAQLEITNGGRDCVPLTPDIAIYRNEQSCVIAEVKKSFPANPDHWKGDFEQLMAYDDDLHGLAHLHRPRSHT